MSASGVQYGWMGEESKCGKMSMTASWTVQGLACISVDCCGAGTDAHGVSPADWKPVVSIPSAFQKSMCKTLGSPRLMLSEGSDLETVQPSETFSGHLKNISKAIAEPKFFLIASLNSQLWDNQPCSTLNSWNEMLLCPKSKSHRPVAPRCTSKLWAKIGKFSDSLSYLFQSQKANTEPDTWQSGSESQPKWVLSVVSTSQWKLLNWCQSRKTGQAMRTHIPGARAWFLVQFITK